MNDLNTPSSTNSQSKQLGVAPTALPYHRIHAVRSRAWVSISRKLQIFFKRRLVVIQKLDSVREKMQGQLGGVFHDPISAELERVLLRDELWYGEA